VPQLPNHLIGRTSFHESSRFLSSGVQSYVGKTRHVS
jgi:hypothetical protein